MQCLESWKGIFMCLNNKKMTFCSCSAGMTLKDRNYILPSAGVPSTGGTWRSWSKSREGVLQ